MPGGKRYRGGESIDNFTIEDYEQLVAGVERYIRSPVVATSEHANEATQIVFPEGFYAKLSGNANPYGMFEQYGQSGGNWENRVRNCKGCAYEVNGVKNLDGKIIWLEPGAPGEYVGQWIGSGSPFSASVSLTVNCAGPYFEGGGGSTVNLYQDGALFASQVIPSSPYQVVTFTNLAAGHTYTATDNGWPTPRWALSPGPIVIPSGATGSIGYSRSFSPAPGYVCYSQACNAFPLSNTMELSGVPGEPVSLTFAYGIPGPFYGGLPGGGWYGTGPGPLDSYGHSTGTVYYSVYWPSTQYGSSGFWTLVGTLYSNSGYEIGPYPSGAAGTTTTDGCSAPFEVTFAQISPTPNIVMTEGTPAT